MPEGTEITFSSNKPEYATVDAKTGEVTAVAEGIATVTATAGEKTDTVTISVKPKTVVEDAPEEEEDTTEEN